MNLAPWLCLSGDELGNAMRTLTYLRRGLGSPWVEVATRPDLVTETNCRDEVVDDFYEDEYDDVYGGTLVEVCDPVDLFEAINLACYCEPLDEGPYLSPDDDDAPWYEASRPESADFLGLVPSSVTLVSTARRSVQPTGRGSVVGPQSSGGFVIAVRADMYAASAAGMAYGERWLAEVLGSGLCDDRLDLEVLLSCPAGAEDAAFRTLPDCGLIDGPLYSPVGPPECTWQQVAFQLASASAWLLGPEVVAYSGPLWDGGTIYAPVHTDDWLGGAGIRIEVVAGPSGITDLVVDGLIGSGADCPPDDATPCWSFTVPEVPAGHRLVVDGATEEAYVENPATGDVLGGLELLEFDDLFSFPNAGSCSDVCVRLVLATAGLGSTARVTSRGMEL